tara:strand:- start:702 stop:1031 length:330 start_codon:yes stop_codon:yes gene_type:complete
MGYLYLIIAIFSEVIATSALKGTLGFSKLFPSLIVVIGYSTSFYFLSLVLKYLPIGITYAIWSGAGIVLMNIIGFLAFNEKIDLTGLIGIALILSGVILIQGFSSTTYL